MIKIAIIGASGYTGSELLRLLALHPDAEVVEATSRQYRGMAVPEVFPALRGFYDGLSFSEPADLNGAGADVAFCALPHGASQDAVAALLRAGCKVIDLSADFRLREAEVYRAWYGEHKMEGLLKEAVYGLPELHRKEIAGARLVANPGCYPTGAALAIAPALKDGAIDPASIIIDSKSGVSGAGRGASLETSFVEVAGGFRAYKVGCHRHTPEIEQELGRVAGEKINVTFTPHLLPTPRGILTTAYASLKKGVNTARLHELYSRFYASEPFVRVLPEGRFPDIKEVRCSNYCDIGVYADAVRGRMIVVSAIDNLVKGASGQAVQNMNIISGLKEDAGLKTPPTPF